MYTGRAKVKTQRNLSCKAGDDVFKFGRSEWKKQSTDPAGSDWRAGIGEIPVCSGGCCGLAGEMCELFVDVFCAVENKPEPPAYLSGEPERPTPQLHSSLCIDLQTMSISHYVPSLLVIRT